MVFSRAGIFVILILIQLLVFLGIPYYLKEYATFIYSAMSVMEIVVLVYIINTEGNPAFKMTWMLCVMALPVIGTVFYIYVHLQLEMRLYRTDLRHFVWRQNLIWIRMRRLQRHSGKQIGKCTAVLLSVTSTWISDLPQYGSRIFPGGRG